MLYTHKAGLILGLYSTNPPCMHLCNHKHLSRELLTHFGKFVDQILSLLNMVVGCNRVVVFFLANGVLQTGNRMGRSTMQ